MRGEGRRGAVRVGETGEAGCLSEAAETATLAATYAEPAAVRARRAGVPKRCGNGASLVQTHFFSVYFCITLNGFFGHLRLRSPLPRCALLPPPRSSPPPTRHSDSQF